jgi:hypothetical protein
VPVRPNPVPTTFNAIRNSSRGLWGSVYNNSVIDVDVSLTLPRSFWKSVVIRGATTAERVK